MLDLDRALGTRRHIGSCDKTAPTAVTGPAPTLRYTPTIHITFNSPIELPENTK